MLLVAGVGVLAAAPACDRALDVAREMSTEPECQVDDDCTLMPSAMTCCGECDPAPPFEAVPRTAVDSRLLELETDCAESTRLCEPPICEVVPPSCIASAICLDGRCRVIAFGCDVRIAVARIDGALPCRKRR
jgi:hypothetical protein